MHPNRFPPHNYINMRIIQQTSKKATNNNIDETREKNKIYFCRRNQLWNKLKHGEAH